MSTNAVDQLSASLEDYLEAIFWLVSAKGAARTKDIAKRLGVKAASVNKEWKTDYEQIVFLVSLATQQAISQPGSR